MTTENYPYQLYVEQMPKENGSSANKTQYPLQARFSSLLELNEHIQTILKFNKTWSKMWVIKDGKEIKQWEKSQFTGT